MFLIFRLILLVTGIAFFSLNSFAANETNQCVFSLNCENGGTKFSLKFKSPTNDCTNDDMQISYEKSKKSQNLGLPKAWYMYTPHIAKIQNSICKSTEKGDLDFAAYSVNPTQAMFFVKKSNRPGLDQVVAVLMNSKNGKVLDTKLLGTSKNQYVAVLKSGKGFKTRIVNDALSFHDEVACDCDAPFVDDWLQVSVNNNKIETEWMK